MVKPDPRLIKHVLDVIDCPPSRCVFTDDKSENVEAAQALGMHGHVFTSAFEFGAALGRLGYHQNAR